MRYKINEKDEIEKEYSDTYSSMIKRRQRDNFSEEKRKKHLDSQREYSRLYRDKKRREMVEKMKESPDETFSLKSMREMTYNKTIELQDAIALQIKQIIKENLSSIPDVPKMIGLIRPVIQSAKGHIESELTLEYTAQQIWKISQDEHKVKFRLQLKTARLYVVAVRRLYDMLPTTIRGNTEQPVAGNLMPLEFLRNTHEIIRWIMFEGKIQRPGSALHNQRWSLGTRRAMIGNITGLLRRLENFSDEYAIYADKHIQLIKQILEIRKKNGLTDAEKKQYLMWPTIMKVWDDERRFDIVEDYNREFYKAIVAVYTLCDDSYVRRAWDYSAMKIARLDEEIILSDE